MRIEIIRLFVNWKNLEFDSIMAMLYLRLFVDIRRLSVIKEQRVARAEDDAFRFPSVRRTRVKHFRFSFSLIAYSSRTHLNSSSR